MVTPTISRDELTNIYKVSQGYLGYLLREKKIPLPVRINGEILWYKDEIDRSLPKIQPFLARRAQRGTPADEAVAKRVKTTSNLKVIN